MRWSALCVLLLAGPAAADEAIEKPIAALKAVDREGKNNDLAGQAWKALVSQGGKALLPTLEAVDDANATAANWLLTAAGAVAEAETKAGRPLPADKLEALAKNTKFAASARNLAFELLAAQDKTAPDRLLPGFLNDPSPDLRRAAVAAELAKIEKAAKASAKDDYLKVLGFARDRDQVDAIVKKLEKDYQTKVSVAEHFGFITNWDIVGPFPSSQGKALSVHYPPEEKVVLNEKLKGKGDAEVAWKPFTTRDPYGMVDFNKEIGKNYDAAAYAAAVLVSEKETPVEIRVGSPNALQVFLNGKKLFEREEYHHGANTDYHIGKGVLKVGQNTLVVKICQNNQKEMWAQTWAFQARACDATGAPIPGVTQLVGDKTIKLGSLEEKK
jgi:hypothetical protein